MKKWLKKIGLGIVVVLVILILAIISKLKDRHPGYQVAIDIENTVPDTLKVGFAKTVITPAVTDRWTDANGDARYNPDDGDTYEDVNQNGKFDAVWIAGFHNSRPANGIHDDLWARAMVIDDGTTTIALVALDVIGFGSDEIIRIRKKIAHKTAIDYVIITSTHTHEGPDLIGLWGESEYKSGVDKKYLKYVLRQTEQVVLEALENVKPAKLRFAQDLTGAEHLVTDSRKPRVLDARLQVMEAIDLVSNETMGSLVAWANHPETLWDKNLLITSDFPHYVREGIEKGIFNKNGDKVQEGLGGTCIYVNGAIGGLMTTLPDFPIKDAFLDTLYTEPSFDKAKAQGEQLAILGLKALAHKDSVVEIQQSAIRLKAKSVELPMDNKLYRLAAVVGVLDKGFSGWMKIRSEVAYWELGPASFLHQPGEIYPEIVNGGVVQPEGGDFKNIEIVEAVPLRDKMNGDFKFTVGLSNDMIGYIIPKSQWDAKPPYTYDSSDAPYGEINSLGPETSAILYQALSELMEKGVQ